MLMTTMLMEKFVNLDNHWLVILTVLYFVRDKVLEYINLSIFYQFLLKYCFNIIEIDIDNDIYNYIKDDIRFYVKDYKNQDMPYGLIIGNNFFGKVNIQDNKNGTCQSTTNTSSQNFITGYLYITKQNLKLKENKYIYKNFDKTSNTNHLINYVEIDEDSYRTGNSYKFKMYLGVFSIKMIKYQMDICNKIVNIFEENKRCVCLLSGKPGTGKSITANVLCNHLVKKYKNITFISNYNLKNYGANLSHIYSNFRICSNNILVLLINEVDISLERIHNYREEEKNEKQSKEYIFIKDKRQYNDFFDKITIGIMSNIIIIMTTNKSFEWFDAMDKCYMREGRVDLKINYNEIDTEYHLRKSVNKPLEIIDITNNKISKKKKKKKILQCLTK